MQLKVWLSLLLVALGAYGSYAGWRVYQATSSDRGNVVNRDRHIDRTRATGSLADAALVDTSGKPFSLDALKGDVWLASFFFTACPGPCAQMNRALAELQKDEKDPHLKFVSITCDPTNDTPEVLAKYARGFQADPARWSFLSGPFESVQKLGAEAFQVPVGPKMHTERVILVDKWSNVRGLYLTSDPSQVIALKKKIKKLLAEETPPEVSEATDAAAGEAAPTTASEQPAADDAPASNANQETSAARSTEPAAESAPADAASEKTAPTEGTP
jgi:cytochrome oxidase Cu insertion factor (SCO1/SenC/PrrC family)